MNKAINAGINPAQRRLSRISPLVLALLIVLPGLASARGAAGEPATTAEPSVTATTAPSEEAGRDRPRAKQGVTGSPKRMAAGAGTGTAPPADMRGWVPRLDYKHCPNGTTSFVAEDGGVKCWAGPVN